MRSKFSTDLKEAMKAGDKRRVDTIRLVRSAIQEADLKLEDKNAKISDDQILAVLQNMVKKRKEAAEIYEKSHRPELERIEREEIEIISGYLPAKMDDAAMAEAVKAAIAEIGATSMKDMGKVVGALKAKYANEMDFAKASSIVKAALSG